LGGFVVKRCQVVQVWHPATINSPEYVSWIVYLNDKYLCRCEARSAARRIAKAFNTQGDLS
jgi:hypothetical protein